MGFRGLKTGFRAVGFALLACALAPLSPAFAEQDSQLEFRIARPQSLYYLENQEQVVDEVFQLVADLEPKLERLHAEVGGDWNEFLERVEKPATRPDSKLPGLGKAEPKRVGDKVVIRVVHEKSGIAFFPVREEDEIDADAMEKMLARIRRDAGESERVKERNRQFRERIAEPDIAERSWPVRTILTQALKLKKDLANLFTETGRDTVVIRMEAGEIKEQEFTAKGGIRSFKFAQDWRDRKAAAKRYFKDLRKDVAQKPSLDRLAIGAYAGTIELGTAMFLNSLFGPDFVGPKVQLVSFCMAVSLGSFVGARRAWVQSGAQGHQMAKTSAISFVTGLITLSAKGHSFTVTMLELLAWNVLIKNVVREPLQAITRVREEMRKNTRTLFTLGGIEFKQQDFEYSTLQGLMFFFSMIQMMGEHRLPADLPVIGGWNYGVLMFLAMQPILNRFQIWHEAHIGFKEAHMRKTRWDESIFGRFEHFLRSSVDTELCSLKLNPATEAWTPIGK